MQRQSCWLLEMCTKFWWIPMNAEAFLRHAYVRFKIHSRLKIDSASIWGYIYVSVSEERCWSSSHQIFVLPLGEIVHLLAQKIYIWEFVFESLFILKLSFCLACWGIFYVVKKRFIHTTGTSYHVFVEFKFQRIKSYI